MLALLSGTLVAAAAVAVPEPTASYDIRVRLDPTTHSLSGRERIGWRNSSSAPTSEIWLHLYLNAFANDETTFMRRLGRQSLRRDRRPSMAWGGVRMTRLATASGTDLLPAVEFVRPDDGNEHDLTVARVQLPSPVPPGGGLELDLDFEAQLPRIVARTGFARDFHLVGQWFPKLGVLEGDDPADGEGPRWSCHQYHLNSEFYADFGSYRVEVEVPEGWAVGATGVEVGRWPLEVEGKRWQRIAFRADAVHDFAWTAAPAELMAVVEADFDPGRDVPAPWLERAARLLGRSPAELELPPTRLRLLLPRSQKCLEERMLRAVRLSLAWLGLRYGPYPYPQLTVVSPPPTAEEAGGMEYPTFITTGASRFMAYPPFARLGLIERVTVHELAHQYFYGLLASDEGTQAWLDEGASTFAELSFLEDLRRDRLTPAVILPDPWAVGRLLLSARDGRLRVDQPAWQFESQDAYFFASYGKAAVALKTLEGLLGEETFARAMRSYVERFRFRHPTGTDLEATLGEAEGESLDWFFDQALTGEATPDWAVVAVRQRRVTEGEGTGRGAVSNGARRGGEEAGTVWEAEVELARLGDFVAPVEVELAWEDGTVERRVWSSTEERPLWRLRGSAPLVEVVVDPAGAWALELERGNNSWRAASDRGPARRLLWWLRPALASLDLAWLPWS